jgi:hypothetical protein
MRVRALPAAAAVVTVDGKLPGQQRSQAFEGAVAAIVEGRFHQDERGPAPDRSNAIRVPSEDRTLCGARMRDMIEPPGWKSELPLGRPRLCRQLIGAANRCGKGSEIGDGLFHRVETTAAITATRPPCVTGGRLSENRLLRSQPAAISARGTC